MRPKTCVFWAALILVTGALIAPANAGWVMTDADGSETFVSKGKMASAWEGGGMIMDAKDGTLFMYDSEKKVYVKSTVEEFCTGTKEMFDQMMKQMPPEQREMMKEMMGGKGETNVTVKQQGTGEKIAGYATNKYDVMNNDDLYEEIWIATDKELVKDFEPFMSMVAEFVSCSAAIASFGQTAPEATPEYIKLVQSGVMLRVINHGMASGQKATDVKELVKQDVPDSKFAAPEGYRKVEFAELLGMQ